ncbi:hypothetical protein L228DRAFT_271305 [Xylona heveae TC161]|uniref:Uncharacterized protein n=1 Tax=Xylona heveae (strain CBS 132557 / TC161) TaxID=1328760 RepID=A0A164ZTV6_XYLHT|nr:hypothetical protein L228DRAFT_271305 [Xylona heveae TC161]KZF19509.1 hypothetical protein L228DRAFT_271305 [Xylona heveae TC161]
MERVFEHRGGDFHGESGATKMTELSEYEDSLEFYAGKPGHRSYLGRTLHWGGVCSSSRSSFRAVALQSRGGCLARPLSPVASAETGQRDFSKTPGPEELAERSDKPNMSSAWASDAPGATPTDHIQETAAINAPASDATTAEIPSGHSTATSETSRIVRSDNYLIVGFAVVTLTRVPEKLRHRVMNAAVLHLPSLDVRRPIRWCTAPAPADQRNALPLMHGTCVSLFPRITFLVIQTDGSESVLHRLEDIEAESVFCWTFFLDYCRSGAQMFAEDLESPCESEIKLPVSITRRPQLGPFADAND